MFISHTLMFDAQFHIPHMNDGRQVEDVYTTVHTMGEAGGAYFVTYPRKISGRK